MPSPPTSRASPSLIIRQAQETLTSGTPRLIQSKKTDDKGPLDTQIPDWQELFGSASTCACSECGAIDGPASYFVSLLEFLHRMPAFKGQTPLQVLLSRRPDLGNLQLTCANADTALPYVDIVNEILESYLAQNGDLTKLSVHDTPSDATTATLDVTPEYTQTPEAVAAYQKLDGAGVVYPYTLPFDRYLATVRTYLDFLGTSLYHLLHTYALPVAGPGPSSASLSASMRLAAEYLRISEPELNLIAGQDFAGAPPSQPATVAACFGYATVPTSWQSDIAEVETFLNKTDLSFNDLLDLIQTHYLNPQRLDPTKAVALTLPSPPKDPCDVTAMTIKNVQAFLPPLPAFIRLRRKLGWKIPELDYALRAFGEAAGSATTQAVPISPRFVLIAADIEHVRKTLNLSIGETNVALWKDIDTDGRASRFMSLFQNKAVLNPPDPGLQLLYQVPLSALPKALPTTWKYDGSQQLSAFYENGHLQFVGTMTDSQRDDLLKWAGTQDDAILAVQLLYQQRWYDGIKIAGKPPFVPILPGFTPQITTPGGGGVGAPAQPDPARAAAAAQHLCGRDNQCPPQRDHRRTADQRRRCPRDRAGPRILQECRQLGRFDPRQSLRAQSPRDARPRARPVGHGPDRAQEADRDQARHPCVRQGRPGHDADEAVRHRRPAGDGVVLQRRAACLSLWRRDPFGQRPDTTAGDPGRRHGADPRRPAEHRRRQCGDARSDRRGPGQEARRAAALRRAVDRRDGSRRRHRRLHRTAGSAARWRHAAVRPGQLRADRHDRRNGPGRRQRVVDDHARGQPDRTGQPELRGGDDRHAGKSHRHGADERDQHQRGPGGGVGGAAIRHGIGRYDQPVDAGRLDLGPGRGRRNRNGDVRRRPRLHRADAGRDADGVDRAVERY